MTLLYRIHDEIAIELETPTWNTVVRLLEDELKVRAIMAVTGVTTTQLNGLVNAIQAHLQHLGPPSVVVPRAPADDNSDLF
jgi:hypothetical protein